MIAYGVLRFITGTALRWFYSDITVLHVERVPPDGQPALLVVNHPNALVDALVVGWAVPRRLTVTAKATLFDHRLIAAFLHYMNVVPLKRLSDDRHRRDQPNSSEQSQQARNAEAFRAILQSLEHGGAVLMFPEGKSHDEPALAPLRTGPARIVLQARAEGRAAPVAIVPIGLVFEEKETVRSRVLVNIGKPFTLDEWSTATDRLGTDTVVRDLTAEIDRRLRAVTLNYATSAEVRETRGLARALAALLEDPPPVGARRPFSNDVDVERRVAHARELLRGSKDDGKHNQDPIRPRADRFLSRVQAFESTLRAERIRIEDVAISLEPHHGVWFIVREGAVIVLAGSVALWGRVNHWLPFRLARALGRHDMTSRDQPAMRTILAGVALVILFYISVATAVTFIAGGVPAMLYILSLPLAADVDLRLSDRMRQASDRMRTYLRFRRKPVLRQQLSTERKWLRDELLELTADLRTIEQSAVTHE